MSDLVAYEKVFLETIHALGQDQLDQLIVVGGWCPYLYTKYLWKKDVPFPRTLDIDFAVMNPSPKTFSLPVYDRLSKAGFYPELVDLDDENRFQFVYRDKDIKVSIDFITSSDNAPREPLVLKVPFVECFPIDEADILFRAEPSRQTIRYQEKDIRLQFANPSTFLIQKGLIIDRRMPTGKSDKDLASVAFVLRFAPDRQPIIEGIRALKNYRMFPDFRKKMKKLFQRPGSRGYRILEPFFQGWNVPRADIAREIEATFEPLLQELAR
ncbi:MAG: hypothetical protein HYT97_05185 [Elusimicrobia bacterium]|nr:hypothetical protein [Elusimicrobiota bacterium]